MASTISLQEFSDLFDGLLRPGALTELAVLAGCLGLAAALVRLLRGRQAPKASIWIGRRGVDGVLFPVLALILALVAKVALASIVHAAVFKVAVPVLFSLAVIRLVVRVLHANYPDSQWMRWFERSLSWLAWLAVVLWVTGVLPTVLDILDDVRWKIGTNSMSLRSLVEGLFSGAIALVLVLWLSSAIERRLMREGAENLSVRKMAANSVRVGLLAIGLIVALSAMGIDLTTLGVLGGALGVGLGFGLQKIAANYVSGFVILAERSLRIGDMVKIDGFEGRITDIRTRYTVIRSLGGRESVVPNENLITQRVENASLADPRLLLTTNVQVAYGTDVRALQAALEQAAQRVSRVLADPAPSAWLSAFAPDGMEMVVNFWISDPENGQGNVRSEVNLQVLETLNALGVRIPFPQRVVHGLSDMVLPGLNAQTSGLTRSASELPAASAATPSIEVKAS